MQFQDSLKGFKSNFEPTSNYITKMRRTEIIEKRSVEIGRYMVDTGCSIRKAARKFDISKSTVYKDVAERLLIFDSELAASVRRVLKKNKDERHIRGGNATKKKYQYLKEII